METDPFRIRGHVAEFDAIVEEIKSRSVSTRENLRMAEIAYGDRAGETLDIFFPDDARDERPVHMFIHGGYWRMFSKSDYSYVADTVTGAGAIAVIIDYALMPKVRMEILVDQVRRAKTWVVENIARHGGDPSHLTVSGHSAGAHLASFLFHRASARSGVAAALLVSGIYDLKPLQSSFLSSEIGITDLEVAAFSPMAHSYDQTCEAFVVVGGEETPPFHHQANAFSALLRRQGLPAIQEKVHGLNHMSIVRDLGFSESAIGRILAKMIEETA